MLVAQESHIAANPGPGRVLSPHLKEECVPVGDAIIRQGNDVSFLGYFIDSTNIQHCTLYTAVYYASSIIAT